MSSHYCIECNSYINYEVYKYSLHYFNYPLCIEDQKWINTMLHEHQTTQQTVDLYLALKKRGVPAELEKWDGYKTIDIAVTDAKVNIEVDGQQHNYNPRQALSDLQRTYYSFKKGYLTLRIPNRLIEWDINETADYITDFLNVSREKK